MRERYIGESPFDQPDAPGAAAATCPGCGQTERWCRCQPPDDDDGVWVDENGPVDAAAYRPEVERSPLTLELRALKILSGLPPNARLAAANWLLALNEDDARQRVKRELRNARRRAARRKAAA